MDLVGIIQLIHGLGVVMVLEDEAICLVVQPVSIVEMAPMTDHD